MEVWASNRDNDLTAWRHQRIAFFTLCTLYSIVVLWCVAASVHIINGGRVLRRLSRESAIERSSSSQTALGRGRMSSTASQLSTHSSGTSGGGIQAQPPTTTMPVEPLIWYIVAMASYATFRACQFGTAVFSTNVFQPTDADLTFLVLSVFGYWFYFMVKVALVLLWAFIVEALKGRQSVEEIKARVMRQAVCTGIVLAGLLLAAVIYYIEQDKDTALKFAYAVVAVSSSLAAVGFMVYGALLLRWTETMILLNPALVSDRVARSKTAALRTVAAVAIAAFTLRAIINLLFLIPQVDAVYNHHFAVALTLEYALVEICPSLLIIVALHWRASSAARQSQAALVSMKEPLVATGNSSPPIV